MRAKPFFNMLAEKDRDLAHDLLAAGGLRGILDQPSAEWNNTTLDEKVIIIERLVQAGISIPCLVQATADSIEAAGHTTEAAYFAVAESFASLLEHKVLLALGYRLLER